jgi:hypothetical protein
MIVANHPAAGNGEFSTQIKQVMLDSTQRLDQLVV